MTDYIKSLRKTVGHAPIMQCGGSVIAINEKNEILLQKRCDNGCWGYAGGSVELDEMLEETAKRELFEETGLIANKLELYGVFSGPELYYIYPNGDEVSNIDIVYICRDYNGELKCEEAEVSELRFFPFDKIPENISTPNKRAIEKFINENLKSDIDIQPITPDIRNKVTDFIRKEWLSTDMLIRGEIIDMTKVDGFVVLDKTNEIKGLITYIFSADYLEITSLNSIVENKGIGTALINKCIEISKAAGCGKIKVLTTNDNINAIKFYQKRGFNLLCVNQYVIDKEREQKPQIPFIGQNGIPMHHEVDFEMILEKYIIINEENR